MRSLLHGDVLQEIEPEELEGWVHRVVVPLVEWLEAKRL